MRIETHTDWYCPNCGKTDQTAEHRPHSRFHICPKLHGLTAPMLVAGTAAKVESHLREDYVGSEIVSTDDEGKPVMSVVTTRDDGQDVAVFAPTATGGSDIKDVRIFVPAWVAADERVRKMQTKVEKQRQQLEDTKYALAQAIAESERAHGLER